VAVIAGAGGAGGPNKKADSRSITPGWLLAFFVDSWLGVVFAAFPMTEGAVLRSVAALTEAIGAIKIMKESRQAPNTLLLLGVVVIDRYMGTPYKICSRIAESAPSSEKGARGVRMNPYWFRKAAPGHTKLTRGMRQLN
jgi:hypothetical protein